MTDEWQRRAERVAAERNVLLMHLREVGGDVLARAEAGIRDVYDSSLGGEPFATTIDRDRILTAVRNADRETEIHGLQHWMQSHNVSISGLIYVANQRALRGAMVIDGQDPTNRTTTVVDLPPEIEAQLPTIAATWIDGFAAGLTVKQSQES